MTTTTIDYTGGNVSVISSTSEAVDGVKMVANNTPMPITVLVATSLPIAVDGGITIKSGEAMPIPTKIGDKVYVKGVSSGKVSMT